MSENERTPRPTRLLIKVAAAAVLTAAVHTLILRSATVEGASMAPHFAEGDRLVVNLITYRLDRFPTDTLALGRAPRRGDVVVADNPVLPGQLMIKRIVALPGEHVRVDELGRVSVDGTALAEPYLEPPTGMLRFEPVERDVKADEYFLLGDNRELSTDSRAFGPVPRATIRGLVAARYWPLATVGLVDE